MLIQQLQGDAAALIDGLVGGWACRYQSQHHPVSIQVPIQWGGGPAGPNMELIPPLTIRGSLAHNMEPLSASWPLSPPKHGGETGGGGGGSVAICQSEEP